MNNIQKYLSLSITFGFLMLAGIPMAHSDETILEKVQATSKDTNRGMSKGAHRAEELFCAASDAECAARKAGNRVLEAKDAAVDGAVKLKNKVD